MKPFQVPLLCAIAFAALFSIIFWGPLKDVSTIALQLWIAGLTVLTIATAVTLIRAVSGRVRGSRIKRFVLWILATPTIIAAALLGLMGLLSAVFGQDEFGAMLLIMLVLFGGVAGGMVTLLILAAFPSKPAEAAQ